MIECSGTGRGGFGGGGKQLTLQGPQLIVSCSGPSLSKSMHNTVVTWSDHLLGSDGANETLNV